MVKTDKHFKKNNIETAVRKEEVQGTVLVDIREGFGSSMWEES